MTTRTPACSGCISTAILSHIVDGSDQRNCS
jgi:hypothetical protein